MATSDPSFGSLVWGTLCLRPYVFAFLAVFAVAAGRDLGVGRMLSFLAWGWAVAFTAEWASTRVGIPFGLYHYTGDTRGLELFVSNVPFFDSLSFPFLAYAAFCLARWATGGDRDARVVWLSGALMTLLDVVIDPVAVRGERWFLGRVFFYPEGGVYFGVPLSNFAGWLLVGWVTVGGYVLALARGARPRAPGAIGPGIALYYAVLAFNLAITAWIREIGLLVTGILIHGGAFLLLYVIGPRRNAPSASSGGMSRP